MSKIIIFILFFILSTTIFAQDIIKYKEFHKKAVEAYYAKDSTGWLENNQKALEILPYHPRSIYYLADAYAQNNLPEKSILYLTRAIEFGFGWNVDKDENFNCIREHAQYKTILQRIDKLRKPINNSKIAFTIKERDLIPEGIAFDSVEECFYLSSIYKSKIIKIDKNGVVSDFTIEKQDGLRPVTGMKVDENGRILWVCSEVSSMSYKNPKESEMGWSGVFKYDLETGKLIKKYTIQEENINHLFNDIIITRNGDVYLTDSDARTIFTINHKSDKLELFFRNEQFGYLNGIALAKDEKSFYFAENNISIAKMNIKTKSIKYLDYPENSVSIGIDGLYFYKNSLIAVQNGFGEANRISRLYLDKEGTEIVKYEILEMNNPYFIIPTTGAIAGKEFYYIANSQLGSFDKNHKIFPNDKLKDVIILKITL